MNGNANANPDPQSEAPDRAIDPVLLNAIADVAAGGNVLADDESEAIVRETVQEVTTKTDRDRFTEAIDQVNTSGEESGDAREAVEAVVDPVREALAERGARVVVDHETPIPVDPDAAAIYDFATNKDPSALESLNLPDSVVDDVNEGAEYVAEGAFEAAAESFTRAVDEVGTGEGSVTTRTLAALAHHWAGNDHGAIDFVEEALHLHRDAWTPTIAGHSADPDESFARPQQFRDGKYAAMATLRYTIDCPEGTSITPFLGLDHGNDGVDEWVELEGTDKCTPIHRLGSDPVLRLRLSGEAPEFPAMHGYYVGLGVVDLEVTELRAVYRLFVNGPLGEAVTETIRVTTEE